MEEVPIAMNGLCRQNTPAGQDSDEYYIGHNPRSAEFKNEK